MRFSRALAVATHALAAALVVSLLVATTPARADDPELYARVVVDSTVLRSGPSFTYRRVYVARRGDVFPVRERATRAYWFRVGLPDGTSAWIMGDAVYNHEVGEEEATSGRFLPGIFAPPALEQATGEIAVNFGILDSGGIFAVRPSLLLAPTFGVELTLAGNVARAGQLLIGGIGGVVNVFPRSPVVPFFTVGGGAALSRPNSDTFLLGSGTTGVAYGGLGLRIGFKYRLTIRLEARAYAFYEANRYVTREELSGGVTVFF